MVDRIPYELIITSASRPHLLKPTLESLFAHLDRMPERLLLHDDAVFDGRAGEVGELAFHYAQGCRNPSPCLSAVAPPYRLGKALAFLLTQVRTEYALYTQDDFLTVRDLPIAAALEMMEHFQLNQIRFNKRATMAVKDTWRGPWAKMELMFRIPEDRPLTLAEVGAGAAIRGKLTQALTVSDHWYFQTGLWRVAPIKAAVDWWMDSARQFRYQAGQAERLINEALDGEHGAIPGVNAPVGAANPWDPMIRAAYQKTFIWGPIGEDRFVRHIGVNPSDWAGDHAREPHEADPAVVQRAQDEIRKLAPRWPGEGHENC